MALTHLPAEKVERFLLSGVRAKLKSGDDRASLELIAERFRAAGLEVLIESAERTAKPATTPGSVPPAATTPRSGPPPAPASNARRGRAPLVLAFLGMALLVFLALGAYVWFWLNEPPPERIEQAESALANGRLIALGHLDIGKAKTLQTRLFGLPDADAEPGPGDGLMNRLLKGPSPLRDAMEHALVALHAHGDESAAETKGNRARGGSFMVLVTGQFDADTLAEFEHHFRLEDAGRAGWHRLSKPSKPDPLACPEADTPKTPREAPLYLKQQPDWLVLTNDMAHGDAMLKRIERSAAATQDLSTWSTYRQGKLASLMVFVPARAGPAWGGLPGMMTAQAVRKAPAVQRAAVSLAVDPVALGLQANVTLSSPDSAWNHETGSVLRQGLEQLTADSQALSPTLAGILGNLSVTATDAELSFDAALDGDAVNALDDVFSEAMGGLFGLAGGGGGRPPDEDQIDPQPTIYADGGLYRALPALTLPKHQAPPLFRSGAFAVDLDQVRRNDSGVLEVVVKGNVALPQAEAPTAAKGFPPPPPKFELALSVAQVLDAEGDDLLRDERCAKLSEVTNGNRNQEPATSTHGFNGQAQVAKWIRLRPGVPVESIHAIKGRLRFSAPGQVRVLKPRLRPGEVVEAAGLRFHVSRVAEDSVAYQVSGERDRLLEVRGLNASGQPLRAGWKMSQGDSGRITQGFQGRVRGLEVYVAQSRIEHSQPFTLSKLFTAPPEKDEPAPSRLAPQAISEQTWRDHLASDLSSIAFDRKRFFIPGKSKTALGGARWDGLKAWVTHTPSQRWNGGPTLHLALPLVPELPGVLSALAYRIEEPAPKAEAHTSASGPARATDTEQVPETFVRVSYPYRTQSGEWVGKWHPDGKPYAAINLPLDTGLEENQALQRLAGELIVRLPRQTRSTRLPLNGLWDGDGADGVTVRLSEISRGMFPGYGIRLDGALNRLVNVHGIAVDGSRIEAKPINYQSGAYWTATLPFGHGIKEIELLTATDQAVYRYPFDIRPRYPVDAARR